MVVAALELDQLLVGQIGNVLRVTTRVVLVGCSRVQIRVKSLIEDGIAL